MADERDDTLTRGDSDALPETTAATANAVADIAGRRALGWHRLTQVFVSPNAETAAELRDGAVLFDLARAVEWLTGEVFRFGPVIGALDKFSRTAPDRDEADDLRHLIHEWTAVADDSFEVAADTCRHLEQLCRDEQAAWLVGDVDRAKGLRVHQADLLRGPAADELIPAASRLAGGPRDNIYVELGRFVLDWLSVEAGVDFARNLTL